MSAHAISRLVSRVAGGSKRLRDSSDDGDVRAYVVATLG
jgi:hypothetical protein